MRQSLLLGALFFLAACGGAASPGATCSVSGFLCFDGANAMECQLGKWAELPCRGPQGCQSSGGTVTCDMSADLEGDGCASTAVGFGMCTTDGTGTLECRNDSTTGQNFLKKTNMCRTCNVQTDSSTQKQEVVCQP
jgi:hypothetical protein